MRYVTSFGPEGYELYGRDFLRSFVKCMEAEIDVYVEKPCDFKSKQVRFRRLQDVEGYSEFVRLAKFPAMNGLLLDNPYNYKYAVFKFCRKQFAQMGAAKEEGENPYKDWLIWIDADIFLGQALPVPQEGPFMHYLGRPEWHSCASYVAWDLRHQQSEAWWFRLKQLYDTGSIFALPEWHDSYVNDWLRANLKIHANDLALPYKDELKGSANVFDYVFKGSHHKKGNLKYYKST